MTKAKQLGGVDENGKFRCFYCGGEVIWGGDEDANQLDEDYPEGEIVTNLTCSQCGAEYIVFHDGEPDHDADRQDTGASQ